MKIGLAKFIEVVEIYGNVADREMTKAKAEGDNVVANFLETKRNLLDLILDIYEANDAFEVRNVSDKLKQSYAKAAIGLISDLDKDDIDRQNTEAKFSSMSFEERAKSLPSLMDQNAHVNEAVIYYYLQNPDEFAQLVILARGVDEHGNLNPAPKPEPFTKEELAYMEKERKLSLAFGAYKLYYKLYDIHNPNLKKEIDFINSNREKLVNCKSSQEKADKLFADADIKTKYFLLAGASSDYEMSYALFKNPEDMLRKIKNFETEVEKSDLTVNFKILREDLEKMLHTYKKLDLDRSFMQGELENPNTTTKINNSKNQSQSTSATNGVTYPKDGHVAKLNQKREQERQMAEDPNRCACQLI